MKKNLPLPITPHLFFETRLWQEGLNYVAGIDEAGRGALAGPVAAGAVIFPSKEDLSERLEGLRDSKQLSPALRYEWHFIIQNTALDWSVGFASDQEIDQIGILPATQLAMQRAVAGLRIIPNHLLVDFLFLPQIVLPQTALVKGDCRSLSIAAASVMAKYLRDTLMQQYDRQYRGYGFANHKGYGTAAHLKRIEQLGPCPIHRRSFAPFKPKQENIS